MITYTLLALIIAVSLYSFNDRNTLAKFLFHPYSIKHYNQHYRFLTHAFIHGDYLHLLFNCFALYSFGYALEERVFSNPDLFDPRIGRLYYLLLFTGGVYAASLAEFIRNKDNPDYTSLGASGAVSSIMFCYIMISPFSTISLFFFPMPGWVAGLLLLVVSYILIIRKRKGLHQDNISHEAHFWGAIYGIVFELVTRPDNLRDLWYRFTSS